MAKKYTVSYTASGGISGTFNPVWAETAGEAEIKAASYAHSDGCTDVAITGVLLVEENDGDDAVGTYGYRSYSSVAGQRGSDTESNPGYTSYSSMTNSQSSMYYDDSNEEEFEGNLEESSYTSYASVRDRGVSLGSSNDSPSYTPYSSVAQNDEPDDATVAGYTPYSSAQATSITPTAATSYHRVLDSGYAPYRSFRVKLPVDFS